MMNKRIFFLYTSLIFSCGPCTTQLSGSEAHTGAHLGTVLFLFTPSSDVQKSQHATEMNTNYYH